jgi:hypothetical protein
MQPNVISGIYHRGHFSRERPVDTSRMNRGELRTYFADRHDNAQRQQDKALRTKCKYNRSVNASGGVSRVQALKYKVYDPSGAVVKDTDDIKIARNAENFHKGFIKVRQTDGIYA